MSLNKEFFNRPTNITAKVICDSISEQGVRLTTLEIEYPRFIHSELLTHRTLSKNSSSSRAIPIQKMIDQIEINPATPLYWGKTKSGMQADCEIDEQNSAAYYWIECLSDVKKSVNRLSNLGLHKQVPNRLLEPFQMMKVVITGTDWDNFFNLRIHKDAQPEICMLAYKMYEAMSNSQPQPLKEGEWHLPYVNIITNDFETYYNIFHYDEEVEHTCEQVLTLEQAIKISAATCASVSYRTEGMSLEKADKIFDMLIKAEVVHSSPLEHCATPVVEYWDKIGDTFDVFINKEKSKNVPRFKETWQDGITHMNKSGELCSGNFRGWVQYRHTLNNNTCWKFDFEERMKLFE